MNFLLDQGLPRSAISHLQLAGHDAVHVADLGQSRATDETILKLAIDSERVVVTLDADFHALLAAGASTSPSVIRIRIEGLKGPEIANIILQVVALTEKDIQQGAAVSVTSNAIRVRSLPLGQRPKLPK
ncbi:DUF5615 family PIN-like protein [Aeoliella mucimassa]|uniref:DUF5615 domain-containing protein n=1 Tax=Aeoliella mucimassa TaxID=2527972 RepID=A0A518AIX9_9BACT|nr:DUF5615 family PIN-like protein [Aeoliella mucimassa]QDU54681.1 hypothetical protein Pan181_08640 [Aeoliella mucimassa]